MRSPKLAAMGVATLSGLTPVFFEPTITPTMMIPEHDTSRVECLINGHHSNSVKSLFKSAAFSCRCAFTLQQGRYEGCGHAAGAQQHSVAHLELPLRDPPENHSCYGSQETHHSGLNLEERDSGVYC